MDPPNRFKHGEPSSVVQKALDHHNNEEQEGVDGDDIISDLPDALLCHILSKLPTKHAVGASILSTKWKNLFASIPSPWLEFDDSLLLHPDESSNPHSLDRRKTNFIDFTYRVFDVILRDVNHISHFVLKCSQDYGDSHIIDWTSAALKRNPILVELSISMEYPPLLLNRLSGCTALKYLSLGKDIPLDVHTDSFCLPYLKHLLLDQISFWDDDSVVNLFTACPVLEDLSMCDCHLQIQLLNISIPSLRGLIIEYCFNDEFGYQVLIDTPLLKLLVLKDHAAIGYSARNLTNIRLAHIVVGPTDEVDSVYNSQNIAEFVAACSTAESLFLSSHTIRAVRHSCNPIPMFTNLTWIQLEGFDKSGWELLPQLLESAPNLELFEITEGFYQKGCYANFASRLPENLPVCVSSHLKKIDLWCFTGEEDEMKLVEYFFKTAGVLSKMVICCDLTCDKYPSIRKKLLTLPRISPTCQLFLSKTKRLVNL